MTEGMGHIMFAWAQMLAPVMTLTVGVLYAVRAMYGGRG
jgi:hypothetical protein